jgi:hypothetical protein
MGTYNEWLWLPNISLLQSRQTYASLGIAALIFCDKELPLSSSITKIIHLSFNNLPSTQEVYLLNCMNCDTMYPLSTIMYKSGLPEGQNQWKLEISRCSFIEW